MKVLNVDDTLLPGWIARKDAQNYHSENWPLYNKNKQNIAVKLRELAMAAYWRSNTYINARQKFIAVKVEKPQKADLLQNGEDLEILNAFVLANKIEVSATKNNLLFRLYK